MKRYALLLALVPTMAAAGVVKVTKPTLTLRTDTLEMAWKFDVSPVEANRLQTYAFTPVLYVDKRSWQALPPVVVSGKKFKMRSRDRKLGRHGETKLHTAPHSTLKPYVVLPGRLVKRDNNVVDYRVSLPHQPWMKAGMQLRILQEGKLACTINLPAPDTIKPAPPKPALPQAGQVCEPCKEMVSFLEPAIDSVKARQDQRSLYIAYPSGKTEFDEAYKNNGAEYAKLQAMLQPLTTTDLVTLKAIRICGYASPDGSVKTNERVAAQRAESFGSYLTTNYDFAPNIIQSSSAGEDWGTLVQLLEKERPAYADKVLKIIDTTPALDPRDAAIKKALGASTYAQLMADYYTRLRRLEVSIDYEVRKVQNAEAAKLIHTNPSMLSLQEMFGVAKNYQAGTPEYREVYEIAATYYPSDVVANINAASANIISGDFARARTYMDRVKDDPRAYNNLGVLAWLSGEPEEAAAWFTKALEVEPEKARHNLEAIR